jgi:hypothetical protein
MLTQREVFDKVKTHLLTQNARAETEDSEQSCQYRAPNGLRCAVGCLLSPDIDTTPFEGAAMETYVSSGNNTREDRLLAALADSGVSTEYGVLRMLQDLQRIHDCKHVSNWPKELNTLEAKLFG